MKKLIFNLILILFAVSGYSQLTAPVYYNRSQVGSNWNFNEDTVHINRLHVGDGKFGIDSLGRIIYYNNALPTAGKMLYGNGSYFTTLSLGTANQLLRTNAGATAPEWYTPTFGTGSVTSIATTLPMLGGTITTTGTISLAGLTGYGSSGQLVQSTGTGWTYLTPTYLTSEVDGLLANEGALSVAAGSGITSLIHSNTSGSTDVTLTAGTGLSISENTGTGVITLANTGIITEGDGSITNEGSLTTSNGAPGSILVTSNTSGSTAVTLTGSGINSISQAANVVTITGTEADGSVSNEGSLTLSSGVPGVINLISNTSGSTNVVFAGSGISFTQAVGTITASREALTGDVTASAGSNTTAIASGVIVNADINGSAAIDATKINTGVVDNTEFNYVDGVTSAIQTQINTKAPTASPTFTGTVTIPTPFTLGAVSVTTTGTQLNYLNAATGTTGTTSTNLVYSTSPALTTPNIGTFTAASGTMSGTMTNYNGLAGVNSGIPYEVATVSLTAQSAAIGATTIYTPTADGLYEIFWVATITTAATTSSLIGPFQYKFTNASDNVVKTWPSGNTNQINQTNTNSTATGIISGSQYMKVKASTAIQYVMGYTTSGATAMVYDLSITIIKH